MAGGGWTEFNSPHRVDFAAAGHIMQQVSLVSVTGAWFLIGVTVVEGPIAELGNLRG
jgi:hypothetical protein